MPWAPAFDCALLLKLDSVSATAFNKLTGMLYFSDALLNISSKSALLLSRYFRI
jgi:hypothetical protein